MAPLAALDGFLLRVARRFGTDRPEPRDQLARMAAAFAVLYALTLVPVPYFALLPLTLAYLGVIAVGRAWVANEKRRTEIARQYAAGDPDALPDLRWSALFSAAQLLVLFPLLFREVRTDFGWFAAAPGAGPGNWLWFTVDKTYLKALPDVQQLYGFSVHENTVTIASDWGKHLVMFSRLTFDYLLIQGVLRVVSIRSTIRETMRALPRDPAQVRLLGRRAVGPLIEALSADEASVRAAAARTLGEIGATRAVPHLIEACADKWAAVQVAAADALARMPERRSLPAVAALLSDDDDEVRLAAVRALGALSAVGDAVPHLTRAAGDRSAEVRRAALALLETLRAHAPAETLVANLADPDEEVRRAAARALGQSNHADAVPVLVGALDDPTPEVVSAALDALGEIGDPAAVPEILEQVTSESVCVRVSAARALSRLGDARAAGPLLKACLVEGDSESKAAQLAALGVLEESRAVPAMLEALGAPELELRAAGVSGLCHFPEDARVVPALVPLLDDPEPTVRAAVAAALPQLADADTLGPLRERIGASLT